jgi:hypothetical protein
MKLPIMQVSSVLHLLLRLRPKYPPEQPIKLYYTGFKNSKLVLPGTHN